MEHTRLHHLLSVVEMITFDLSKVWLWNTKNMEHTRLHYLLSAVEMITFRSSINLPNYSCVHDIRKKPKIEDSAKNRQFSSVGRSSAELQDINWLQYWLTKISAKLRRDLVNRMLQEQQSWEQRCLLQVRSNQGPQNGPISALEKVWAQSAILKSACNVHLKFQTENLAWLRHFTSQRLPTQHYSERPSSINHSKLEA